MLCIGSETGIRNIAYDVVSDLCTNSLIFPTGSIFFYLSQCNLFLISFFLTLQKVIDFVTEFRMLTP